MNTARMHSTCRFLGTLLLFAGSAAMAPRHAAAGSVNLWGVADGDTAYYEKFSDGFIRVDLYDPPPRQTQQRFLLISDPSVTVGSTSYDGFPNDANFRLGSVTYDDNDLVADSGVATITALALGVGHDPADPGYFNYYRWQPETTIVVSFEGTVTIANGVVTSIDLESMFKVQFTLFNNTFETDPGLFKVVGNRFDGYTKGIFPNDPDHVIWDFAGTLSTVGTAPLIGDYNNDQFVDAADYVIWRKALGTNYALPNRAPTATGTVGPDDYTAWRSHYGGTLPGAGRAMDVAASQVPEPTAALLTIAALLLLSGTRTIRPRV